MARRPWTRILVAIAAGILLLANGACTLGLTLSETDASSYAGVGPAVVGLLAFYVGAPLALVAFAVAAFRPFEGRAPVLALLAASLAGAAAFALTEVADLPLPIATTTYIALFALGTLAGAAALFMLRRARPSSRR